MGKSIVVLTLMAWAAIQHLYTKVFSGPPIQDVALQFHALNILIGRYKHET